MSTTPRYKSALVVEKAGRYVQSEHVVVAERALGHPLPKGAEVHHVNGNGRDNRNTNLVICENRAYHRLLHVRQRLIRLGVDPCTHKICGNCHEPKPRTQFYLSRQATDRCSAYCKPCTTQRGNQSQRIRRARQKLLETASRRRSA